MSESTGVGYEVKITQNGGEDIILDKKAVENVMFKIDTVDENVKDRSENVVNLVVIKGFITLETKDMTKKLLLWSLGRKSSEVYRNVEIVIRITGDKLIRKYTMDKVFCIDYTEKFCATDSNQSEYELKIAQRKDNFDGIKVIS